ncbi:MAG: methyltransferase [Hamadaea sp.]|nr:methyltransferase [Hamadaea sp.]
MRIRWGNAHYVWDAFNPDSYFAHNYESLRDDDRALLEGVRDFFAGVADTREIAPGSLRGLDIGPGANLYPSLAMLPFCRSLTLREFSAANVRWLDAEISGSYGPSWDAFWDVLQGRPQWKAIEDPRAVLKARSHVGQGSIFDLRDAARGGEAFEIGTMFFVAESLTRRRSEFDDAVRRFVDALVPDAPFACAFMKQSRGYRVDDRAFPAVAIGADDVTECLASVAYDVDVRVIELSESGDPLRDGYEGMILATGYRRREPERM